MKLSPCCGFWLFADNIQSTCGDLEQPCSYGCTILVEQDHITCNQWHHRNSAWMLNHEPAEECAIGRFKGSFRDAEESEIQTKCAVQGPKQRLLAHRGLLAGAVSLS